VAASLNSTRAEVEAARVELGSERERRAETEADVLEARAELEAARVELASERERRTQTEEEVVGELRRQIEEADAAAQAERSRAEEAGSSLNQARAELEAARVELAAERERQTQTEAELVSDLRRRLEEAYEALTKADAQVGQVRAELETAQAELASAHTELGAAPAGELVEELHHKLEHAEATARHNRDRADGAEAALNAERAEAEIRIGVAERRIAELEASLAEARAQELEADIERPAAGPTWDASAQRAFTTALSQSSDWRVSVKSALGVVGSQGGWDAVCAWQPDDLNGFASCFAMWTGENHRLGALETATWQRRQPLTGSTIGEALTSEDSAWLVADARAADRRLQLLAQHGIRGALIVPVKDGARPVAALELLTVGATEPSRELVDAIETIALQLGHFSALLSAGAQPRWRFGRT
jgi:hypothetical protein